MKFIAIICTLTITWIFNIEATHYNDHVHQGEIIECAAGRKQLIMQIKDVMCKKPKPTLIKLIPEPGYTYYPNYALVNRCSGSCPKASCMPVRKNKKNIIVRKQGLYSIQCYRLSVEEHVDCKCACSVKQNHCNSNQIYLENNCACKCKNKKNCDEKRQMVWDEKLCKCMCKSEEICSSGLEWVPSLCRCAKIM